MPLLLKCPSRQHTVRLDSSRFWQKTICPKCRVPIDPTRLRRIIKRMLLLFSNESKSISIFHEFPSKSQVVPIPDEFRFAKLKWRIDKLAKDAWKSQESLYAEFLLNPSELPANSPDKTIEAILNHVGQTAPGLSVPLRVPRVETGSIIEAGQFKTSDGWVSVKLANNLLIDRKAVRAILAHEACHYILANSGIRESDFTENERLTDLCMFVCGLGELFLEGYKRESTQDEYRAGHRLGYLTDAEYKFVAEYVLELRSKNSLQLPTRVEELIQKLAGRVSDLHARERLIKHAKAKYPEKTEVEIYELVIEQFEREHR